MQKITLLLFFLFFCAIAHAQQGYIYPSPSVLAVCRYTHNPTGTYTGTKEVALPLYSIPFGNGQIPISLSYHTGGIKAGQEASWVGTGWELYAGGVIGRIIRGRDDLAPAPAHGWPSNPNALPGPQDDPEPDLFFYHFAGQSGTFLLDTGKVVRLLGQQTFKVELIEDKWVITTLDGYVYHFEQPEHTTVQIARATGTRPTIALNHPSQTYITAWHLTRIRYYKPEPTYYNPEPAAIRLKYKLESDLRTYTTEYLKDSVHATGIVRGNIHYETVKIAHRTPMLTKIEGMGLQAIFHTSARRQDRDFYESFSFDPRRDGGRWPNMSVINQASKDTLWKRIPDDTVRVNETQWIYRYYPQRLDSVIIQEYFIGRWNTVKGFYFRYGLFSTPGATTADGRRLRLDRVIEGFRCETNAPCDELQRHDFQYDTRTFPLKSTKGIDFWGYPNGEDVQNNANNTLLPEWSSTIQRANGTTAYTNSGRPLAKRQPNLAAARAGALTAILHPSRGLTRLYYEPHVYWDSIANQPRQVGGLRLQRVVADGDAGDTLVTQYLYRWANNSRTSGRLHGGFPGLSFNPVPNNSAVRVLYAMSEYTPAQFPDQGPAVGYGRTEVLNGPDGLLGRVVYEHTNWQVPAPPVPHLPSSIPMLNGTVVRETVYARKGTQDVKTGHTSHAHAIVNRTAIQFSRTTPSFAAGMGGGLFPVAPAVYRTGWVQHRSTSTWSFGDMDTVNAVRGRVEYQYHSPTHKLPTRITYFTADTARSMTIYKRYLDFYEQAKAMAVDKTKTTIILDNHEIMRKGESTIFYSELISPLETVEYIFTNGTPRTVRATLSKRGLSPALIDGYDAMTHTYAPAGPISGFDTLRLFRPLASKPDSFVVSLSSQYYAPYTRITKFTYDQRTEYRISAIESMGNVQSEFAADYEIDWFSLPADTPIPSPVSVRASIANGRKEDLYYTSYENLIPNDSTIFEVGLTGNISVKDSAEVSLGLPGAFSNSGQNRYYLLSYWFSSDSTGRRWQNHQIIFHSSQTGQLSGPINFGNGLGQQIPTAIRSAKRFTPFPLKPNPVNVVAGIRRYVAMSVLGPYEKIAIYVPGCLIDEVRFHPVGLMVTTSTSQPALFGSPTTVLGPDQRLIQTIYDIHGRPKMLLDQEGNIRALYESKPNRPFAILR